MAKRQTSHPQGIGVGCRIDIEYMFYYYKDMKIWIVVLVESGIPTEVDVFADEESTIERYEKYKNGFNLEDDEVQIFEKEITCQ